MRKMVLRSSYPACILSISIKIQFFFTAYHVIADRSNSQHLGGDFDASRKIPILPLAAPSLFHVTPFSSISRPTLFLFSTRQFFRLAFQFEMQKSSKHSRLNPESCCRRLILERTIFRA